MKSFWDTLPKPFFVLAPLADVTDPAYRALIAECGKPDVTYTEFVSADGLFHMREKKGIPDEENPLVRDLQYTEGERPILAQFFTSNPETMEYAARYALLHGFDGVDINMGCPDASIEKQGAGAAHIKNPEQACEIIAAAIRGTEGKIPVSVKTRLGYNKIEYQEWLPHLLDSGISALTIHMRTRKEMSKVKAHWELGKEIVSFCRDRNREVFIIGNGDIASVEEGRTLACEQGWDGLMLGRAIFGNPWVFTGRTSEELSISERLTSLLSLAQRFDALRPKKHYAILKKHFKAFVNGFDGAAELRARLMETNNLSELEACLNEFR
ncbi:tRNA-dihydrouridine synthase [Candidatus Parcubacteria bacterium]|nr:tRNA-dihydrouridine synthase [Candidatus Parcubacteria bacterium]